MEGLNKKEYTNELRLTILENSLFHEHLITQSLGDILEIDITNSYTLSDKSSALSLASKINLLIDLKKLEKRQKAKLFIYLEIRNQFLHNWKCKTFEDCFKSLDSSHKALKKLYPSRESLSVEQQMTYCYNALSDDIVSITINHLMKEVVNTKVSRKRNKEDLDKYIKLRSDIITVFFESINSEILSKYKISQEDQIKLLRDFVLKTD